MGNSIIKYSAMAAMAIFGCMESMAAGKCVVKGNNPSMAGRTIQLRHFTERIMNESEQLAETTVAKDGDFKFEFMLDSLTQVFLPSDSQRGFLYVLPGKTYEVSVADWRDRTIQDQLKPYFEMNDYFMRVAKIKPDDVNYKTVEMEDAFDFYQMKTLSAGGNADTLQRSLADIDRLFVDFDSDRWLKRYKSYRKILLESQFSTPDELKRLFSDLCKVGVDWSNPAFWDALNNLSYQLIENTTGSDDYHIFKRIVDEANAKMLLAHMRERFGLTDREICELVSVKAVADLGASRSFEHRHVADLLHNLSEIVSHETTKGLSQKAERVIRVSLPGEGAPNLIGTDMNGKERDLAEYSGQIIYLNMCNSRLQKTEKDLSILRRFQETFMGQLQVINLFVYDDKDRVKKVAERFGSDMQYWIAPDADLTRKTYNARGVPSYFLIDAQGKFIMTRGAEPNDEVRMLLLKMLGRD